MPENKATQFTFLFERTLAHKERGPRLDEFVAEQLPKVSLTRIRRLIEEGDVSVNDEALPKGYRLVTHDRVNVQMFAAEKSAATPEAIPLGILFEDDDLIVINKPTGLLVHPSHAEKSGTLLNGLAYHFWQTQKAAVRPGLVHRLDRDTSGVIVVAKTPKAHRTLSKHFRERWVKKFYLALVSGIVEKNSGEIDAAIGSRDEGWPRWCVMPETEGGRAAQTRFTVKQRFAAHTLLELEPLTGRTHQLRIHCQHLEHPIVGDTVYHDGEIDPLVRRHRLRHQMLHAARLDFRHPATGQTLKMEAPLPDAWADVLKEL
jgi:23S rRNA pseudouridine1911/1915/1917 synthase